MKVIVLASQKGGAGKTTLAAHIAVEAEKDGLGPTVLIDTDPQGSLSDWWNAREAETPALAVSALRQLPEKLLALEASGFNLVVIDTPPAITAAIRDVVKLADFVLIPARPSPHDLRAVGSTVSLVHEAERPFAFAVTQAKGNARLTAQAVAALSEHGIVAPSIIYDRVDYAGSMVDGRTLSEINERSPGADEIARLLSFLKARMSAGAKARKTESTKARKKGSV